MIEILQQRLTHSKGVFTEKLGLCVSWTLTIAIIGFIAFFGWPQQVAALSNIPNENTWVTNGTVWAIADNGTSIIIGGDFTYVGPNTGHGVPIFIPGGALASDYPKVNGDVYAVVPDGSGGWFIGGAFTNVGGIGRNNIAHINASGGVDTGWNANANAPVRALALSGGLLYAGGEFTRIKGTSRGFVAAVSASNASLNAWNPAADDVVRALAVSGSLVYLGGDFSQVGDDNLTIRLAAVDATTGAVADWHPMVDGPFGTTISALVVDGTGTTVYAGGTFTSIGSATRNRIAAIDATSGAATTWDPNANGAVNALLVNGATVYAGGTFTGIGGGTRNRIAAIDATSGAATTWDPNANNAVNALLVNGGTVYAGGSFTDIGGSTRNRLAGLDVTTGVATAWDPNANGLIGTPAAVDALAVSGSKIYAGGSFTSVGGQERLRLAALNASTGTLTSYKRNANDTVIALALSSTTLYVGGDFTTIGGQSRNRLASFNLKTGNINSWNPDCDDSVYALAVSGTTVYAGGSFGHIGGQVRNYIAALDSTGGNATGWDPNADGWVLALAASGSTVYAGGQFFNIGAQSPDPPRSFLAALDTATGDATSWNPVPDSYVYALALNGSTLYVGGEFFFFGSEMQWERDHIGALDIDTGNATSWNPAADNTVWALAVSGSQVYAGGDFDLFRDMYARPFLASLESGTGNVTSWTPSADLTVYALSVRPDRLYVGGSFSFMGDKSQPCFAEFSSAYLVSGTVTSGGSAVPGVTINLTGAATRSTTTDSNGNYSFSGLLNGAYVITPGNTEYTFTPPSINVTVNGADVTAQDFTATSITHSLSGTVTVGGSGLSGVAVNLTGAATKNTTTDSNGNYSFWGISNGVYTVTPSKVGYTFTPQSRGFNVTGADVTGLSFTAESLITCSISGTVTSGGFGFSGATVNLTGAATGSTTTGSNGNYSFSGLSNGAYAVTPNKAGYTFTPLSINVNVSGANVTGQNFSTPLGAATLVLPSGANVINHPAYVWNAVTNAEYYLLAVSDSTGSWPIYKWYSKAEGGCGNGNGNCTVTPDVALACGNGIWYVQTYNAYGFGPWSEGMPFDVGKGTPGKPNPVSPTGPIDTHKPTFTWDATANAEYYQLAVNDATGWPIGKWYSKADAHCDNGTGTCWVAPEIPLASGDCMWYVQAWNYCALGDWSTGMPFKVVGAIPGKPALISPTGTVNTNKPTYIWTAVSNAEYYLLAARDSTGSWPVYTWYTKADAGCGNGDGNCTVTPATALASGECIWYVVAWNYSGLGPWSDGTPFTTLGKASLISPTGTVGTNPPTYIWNAVANADYYLLAANDSTGAWPVFRWYGKEEAGCGTGTGTCSATPPSVLASGGYKWYIQTWNYYGYGLWSEKMDFIIP